MSGRSSSAETIRVAINRGKSLLVVVPQGASKDLRPLASSFVIRFTVAKSLLFAAA